MQKKVNWGILGLGQIAHKFVADLKLIPNATLHAVASTSGERAQNFAAQYDAVHYYGSYEEMMKCPDLDVVYIASRHPHHHENTLLCLKHKIPVLCEKPFAMNGVEVEEMIAASKSNQTFLMEALWTRFLPTTKKVLELIDDDVIGEITGVKADFGFKAKFDESGRLYNQNEGGGALLDIGIYPIFLALLLLGKPEEIKAIASIGQTNVDETCHMLFKYSNNRIANLHASILNETATEAFIYGTKGVIRINSRFHESTSVTLLLNDKEPKDIFFEFLGFGYRYEAEAVMEYLSKDVIEHPLMPHSFSVDLMELLDRVRKEAGIFYPTYDRV